MTVSEQSIPPVLTLEIAPHEVQALGQALAFAWKQGSVTDPNYAQALISFQGKMQNAVAEIEKTLGTDEKKVEEPQAALS